MAVDVSFLDVSLSNEGPRAQADLGAPPNPTGAEIARMVRRGFGLRKFAPPALPERALRVLTLLENSPDEVSIGEIVGIIEGDMLLASQIIRLANTPLYSRGITIVSIEQAVGRLGFQTLRHVVVSAALNTAVFDHPAYQSRMQRLRSHSAATAHVALMIAREVGYREDVAFLAGLFHDIGLAAPLLLLGEVYPEAPPAIDDVWGELIWLHEKINWHVMRFWNLPEAIREVIRYHHQIPEAARDQQGSAVVCLADHIAALCGVGVEEGAKILSLESSEGVTSQADLGRAIDLLGFAAADWNKLVEAAKPIVEHATGGAMR